MSGLGLIGLIIPQFKNRPLLANNIFPTTLQGRVTDFSVYTYSTPSFEGQVLNFYWRDIVLPITGISIGDDESAHNRVWYQVNGEGYAYSGSIQPVNTKLNPPSLTFPRKINLAEVTAPFTDAREYPNYSSSVRYRFYFESTHWVEEAVIDKKKNAWYRVSDEKFERYQYVPASHLRLIPDDELSQLSPLMPDDQKSIEVRLSQQLVIAYEAGRPVFMTRASTGGSFNKGIFATPPGKHMTFHKRPSAHMAAGNLAATGFDLPGVPWVSYITESGVAFHGTYWHNDFGKPRSHGCINIPSRAAKWIYRWTQPVVPPDATYRFLDRGTMVNIIA